MTVDARVVARREDARLGLFVLVYGLVLSPLVHAVVQHGGHAGVPLDAAWVTHGGDAVHAHDTSTPSHGEPSPGARVHSHDASPREQDAASHSHDAPSPGAPVHAHGAASHPHGEDSEAPGSHRHGHFSVEHLQAVLVPAAAPLVAVGLLLTLSWVLRGEERVEPGTRLALHPAMPQGP